VAGTYKRGRVYWARAQRDGVEHRESLKTTDRRAADRRYRQWVERIDALAWDGRPRRTFVEAVEKFIREHCAALKPSTARRYGASLKAMSESFAPLYLDQITRDRLAEYEALRRATPIRSNGKKARLPSGPTIRRDLACLSALFSACEEWEWTPEGSNIVPGYMRRRAKRGLKEAPPRTRYLTEGDEAKLLQAASPAIRAAMIVAIDTGLRLEEQLSLTWPQVDFRRGMITTTLRTKSGRSRAVPMPQRAAGELARLSAQPRIGPVTSTYVFRHDTGERFLSLKTGFKGAVRRAKLADLTWHDLRRTAGCRWLQGGRKMEEVSILLGHSSVKVTERHYAFLEGEAVAQSVAQPPAHRAAVRPRLASKNKRVRK
jgi:integrase